MRPARLPAVASLLLVACIQQGVTTVHPPGARGLTASEAGRLQRAWTVKVGDSITSSPAIAGTRVVAGTVDGTLAAYSADRGREAWRVTGLGSVTGGPSVYQGKVFVGAAGGRVIAFGLVAGERLWEWRAPGGAPAIRSGPVGVGGLLLVATAGEGEAGRVVALDPASGESVWNLCLRDGCRAGDGVEAVLAVDALAHAFVRTGPPDESILALDAGIGKILWRTPIDPGAPGPTLASSGGRELVVAGSDAGSLVAIDARTGAITWRRSPARGAISSPGFDGRTLFAGSAADPGAIFALSPVDGRTLWRHPTPLPVTTMPAVGESALVAGYGSPRGGGLVALATADGRQLWAEDTGAAVVAAPAIRGSSVFAADTGGRLMAFLPANSGAGG